MLKVTSWAPFILFLAQNMAVPIIHTVMAPFHPKKEYRQLMFKCDENGAPTFKLHQVVPAKDPFVVLFTIIPFIWGCTIFFYFYVAVTSYRPPFCTESGFFDYKRF